MSWEFSDIRSHEARKGGGKALTLGLSGFSHMLEIRILLPDPTAAR